MWPAKWINNDADLQALLARWQGTRVQIWEYSVSHSRLLIRMMREKSNGRIADAYVLCRGCDHCHFENGWLGMNISVAQQAGKTKSKPVRIVSDGGRLKVVCISVSAFENETAVFPWMHLADELRGLPIWLGRNNTAAHIEYVLVYVGGETPDIVSALVDRVVEVAISHGGSVSDIFEGLVKVSYMRFVGGPPIQGKRAALVDNLTRDMRQQIKLIHGRVEQHDGKYEVMLGRLSRFEFGQIEEFEK